MSPIDHRWEELAAETDSVLMGLPMPSRSVRRSSRFRKLDQSSRGAVREIILRLEYARHQGVITAAQAAELLRNPNTEI